MNPIPAFNVRSDRPAEDVLTLAVEGDLDLATVPLFQQHADHVLAEGIPALVVIDLAGCEFIDSSGIALLLRQHATLKDHGAALAVVANGHAVHRSLSLTGVDVQLAIFEDTAAAIAAKRASIET